MCDSLFRLLNVPGTGVPGGFRCKPVNTSLHTYSTVTRCQSGHPLASIFRQIRGMTWRAGRQVNLYGPEFSTIRRLPFYTVSQPTHPGTRAQRGTYGAFIADRHITAFTAPVMVCPDQTSSERGVEIRGNTLGGCSLREYAQKDKVHAVQGEAKEQERAAFEDGKFCQLAVGNTVRCP